MILRLPSSWWSRRNDLRKHVEEHLLLDLDEHVVERAVHDVQERVGSDEHGQVAAVDVPVGGAEVIRPPLVDNDEPLPLEKLPTSASVRASCLRMRSRYLQSDGVEAEAAGADCGWSGRRYLGLRPARPPGPMPRGQPAGSQPQSLQRLALSAFFPHCKTPIRTRLRFRGPGRLAFAAARPPIRGSDRSLCRPPQDRGVPWQPIFGGVFGPRNNEVSGLVASGAGLVVTGGFRNGCSKRSIPCLIRVADGS